MGQLLFTGQPFALVLVQQGWPVPKTRFFTGQPVLFKKRAKGWPVKVADARLVGEKNVLFHRPTHPALFKKSKKGWPV